MKKRRYTDHLYLPGGGRTSSYRANFKKQNSKLARIYGFSFEGQYYDLPKPALFLVHGDGEVADRPVAADVHYARAPDEADRTGVAAQDYSFSEDIAVWSYDASDYSICPDVETGTFEQILLDATITPENQSTAYSGAHARLSGAHARLSGHMPGREGRTRA